jgi:hypothetical protein
MPLGPGGRPTVLVLSQVYLPDPASVGQHMADVAAAMASRGHRTVVLTADRGYDDPTQRFPASKSAGCHSRASASARS